MASHEGATADPGEQPRKADGSLESLVDRDEVTSRAGWLEWLEAKLSTEQRAVSAVIVAGILMFLPYLGALGLWDPWETHYGEVARAMIARDDYVYPYWESAYFFSKPALPLWLLALGMFVVGAESPPPGEALGSLVEWGARLPFALLAIGGMWAVYRIGRQLGGRTVGLLAAFVLATCPQFIFIGKQAMTDGPLVALLTIGLALFLAAVFEEGQESKASLRMRIGASAGIAVAVFPQLFVIVRELEGVDRLAILAAALLGAGFIALVMTIASRRDCYLAGFYVAIGLAALAKGLAVLAVVGPVVILYCILSLDAHLLARSKFWLGGWLFLLVAAPWYVTLTLFRGRDDEGLTFTQRFWFHDNFNRVGAGVHGDRAGLGYFLEQLGYGMFPWSATLPFALGLAARTSAEDEDVRRRRATLFVLLWALWCYVFFSSSQTKFHHYIFPALPAMAVLVALWIKWLAEAPSRRLGFGIAIVVLGLFSVGLRDLVDEPRNLVNLFTYKYDRDFPRDIEVWRYIHPIAIGGAVVTAELGTGFLFTRIVLWFGTLVASFLFLPWRLLSLFSADSRARHRDAQRTRWEQWGARFPRPRQGTAILAFVATAGLFGAWISHHHFNMLSPHWSQAHLFKTYYQERRGTEPIYAYQLNWRGETFYSRNRVLQVKESGANQRIKTLVDQPGREFIITEQSRFHTLQNALSPEKRDKLQIIDRSNNKFYLCVVEE